MEDLWRSLMGRFIANGAPPRLAPDANKACV